MPDLFRVYRHPTCKLPTFSLLPPPPSTLTCVQVSGTAGQMMNMVVPTTGIWGTASVDGLNQDKNDKSGSAVRGGGGGLDLHLGHRQRRRIEPV